TTPDEGTGITETHFVKMKTEVGQPVSYRFYAFWEKTDPRFKNPSSIEEILNKDALKLENPVLVNVK
ncbi:MAG: DUF4861 family protein, partial [Bacteroidales bacterium]